MSYKIMSYQSIEEYFAKFPDDIETINVYFDSYYLPDLSRFYKLKNLSCYNNKLVCLPLLPSTLEILWCSNNKLTYLNLRQQSEYSTYCYIHCKNASFFII